MKRKAPGGRAWARKLSSTPHGRRTSMVRVRTARDFGWFVVDAWRSTMRDLTPCRASRIAALRPTGPAPTTRTGVSAEVARSTMRQAPKSGPKRKRPILAAGLLHAKAQTVLLALRSPHWKRPSFPRVSMSGGLDHSENAMGYIEHSLGRSET